MESKPNIPRNILGLTKGLPSNIKLACKARSKFSVEARYLYPISDVQSLAMNAGHFRLRRTKVNKRI